MPPRKGMEVGQHPSYKLTVLDRKVICALYYMGLWTPTRIARDYGVTRKTIYNCLDNYSDLPKLFNLPAHPMYGKLVSLPAPSENN